MEKSRGGVHHGADPQVRRNSLLHPRSRRIHHRGRTEHRPHIRLTLGPSGSHGGPLRHSLYRSCFSCQAVIGLSKAFQYLKQSIMFSPSQLAGFNWRVPTVTRIVSLTVELKDTSPNPPRIPDTSPSDQRVSFIAVGVPRTQKNMVRRAMEARPARPSLAHKRLQLVRYVLIPASATKSHPCRAG